VSAASVNSEDIRDYLSSKGVDEILAELTEEEKTYTQLENAVDVSPATLSKRLKKGSAIDVLEVSVTHQETLEGNINKTEKYAISEEYSDIMESIEERELLKTLRKKRTFEQQANEMYNEFIESRFSSEG
jgi:DNA-binding HxlR family transcriptional regulator